MMDTAILAQDLHARISAAAASWPPGRGSARVVLVEADAWRPQLHLAAALLDDAERERIARRRQARDRDDLTLCYGVHRALLAVWLGCRPSEVPLYRDERGCPRIEGGELATSISHTDGAFAFAFTRAKDGPVGIDIEPAHRASVMGEVARALCHPAEIGRYTSRAHAASGPSLLRLWVRKEAVLKALGTGMEVAMESFQVPESGIVHLPHLEARPLRVTPVDAGALDYECALARVDGVDAAVSWLRP